jgi:hypothetical protein
MGNERGTNTRRSREDEKRRTEKRVLAAFSFFLIGKEILLN